MRKKITALLAGGLTGLIVGVAWAGVQIEGYSVIPVAPAVIRNGALDGGDSVSWTAPLSTSGATQALFTKSYNKTDELRT